ncbi:acyl carrier protein [Maricaulis sp. D1M11]|uniref:acyl carrier protein n=1 Tax=Maricaulis sp. D1M11 TaxID=3076117 RepID=UPI0039B49980
MTDTWNADRLLPIRDWSVKSIASSLKLDPSDIDTAASFDDLGLDSIEIAVLASGLERDFGLSVDPYWFYDYPSIDSFLSALPGLLAEASEGKVSTKGVEV